jgi:hypothetical protein
MLALDDQAFARLCIAATHGYEPTREAAMAAASFFIRLSKNE